LNLIRVMPAKGQDRMSNSTFFLARLMGPVMIAVGVGVFVNASTYRSLAEEFLRSRALIYLSGLLAMTAGMAVVLTHNVWVANWPVLITVLGWLAVFGGAVRIICPQSVERIGRKMLANSMALTAAGAIWLAAGAVLTFFGFFR
jgi:uncharacterized membrane protein